MISSTRDPVFFGVVVNPKTKAPVYVVRASYSNHVQITAASHYQGTYTQQGDAYLNDDTYYAGPTEVSGYPRSHTPGGVGEKGEGYGTCLYTALVLLATARFEGEIALTDVIGNGRGICSTPSDTSRSKAASAWWNGAISRGLAKRAEGWTDGEEAERETETDSGDLSEYISRRKYQNIVDAIHDAVNDTEWSLKDLEGIKVEVEREVPSETERPSEKITVDTYGLEEAEKFNLVAVRQTVVGDLFAWARHPHFATGVAAKNVILALNVSKEDVRLVAKLAAVATIAGATQSEVTAMLMRNRFGADVTSREVVFDVPEVPVATPHTVKPRSSWRPPRHRAPPMDNPPLVIRRNPTPPSSGERRAIEAQLAELERRRADLGWDQLGDL